MFTAVHAGQERHLGMVEHDHRTFVMSAESNDEK
jgi:hypothetical protein